MKFSWPPGATPIDPDEAKGLIPAWVRTQRQLNIEERANIEKAQGWLSGRKRSALDDAFIRRLHQKMFGEVWEWAGKYRLTNKNIGVDWHQIPTGLRQLLDDAKYWCEHRTYSEDEVGVRFHHRLVSIHCFANGNGRHARLATDVLMRGLDRQPFAWGAEETLSASTDKRRGYIAALRQADSGKYGALMEFVRR